MTKSTLLLAGVLSNLISHRLSPLLSPAAAKPFHDYASAYNSLLNIHEGNTATNDPFQNIQLVIHRNGESEPCAYQRIDAITSQTLIQSLHVLDTPLDKYDKYSMDALLTYALAVGSYSHSDGLLMDNGSKCHPIWKEDDSTRTTSSTDNRQHHVSERDQTVPFSPFLQFCDMGPNRTPVQNDHEQIVRIPPLNSLPCHFHTREGLRIDSLEMLANLAANVKMFQTNSEECDDNKDDTCINNNAHQMYQLHLYAVPAGRLFMFAPKYIGEVFTLSHLPSSHNTPISLTVLSLSPRLFDIHNFFTRDESSRIVDKALRETRELYRMKRSSTGASGLNDNSRRTGENGFDTNGKEARAVKRRCLKVLGMDVYEEALTDGLQVLRYNQTAAYAPHLDWIDDSLGMEEHDYDSSGVGSNRFATVLMYMSDLEESDGGETVFPKGWPVGVMGDDRDSFNAALSRLREGGDLENLLSRGSWEESLVAQCRSRLSVRPHSGRAVLFYNQEPDGSPDPNSVHGGCPVIGKEKWAGEMMNVLFLLSICIITVTILFQCIQC